MMPHRVTKSSRSVCKSAAPLFSATVRMMMPNPGGRMLCIRRFKRFRSSSLLMRPDSETLSLKGTKTMYRPGSVTSAVKRGPFELMGSLAT